MASALATAFARAIKRGRLLVFAVWLAVAVCGLKWGLKFIGATVTTYSAPSSSESERAASKLKQHFPSKAHTEQYVILFEKLSSAGLTEPLVHVPNYKQVELALLNLTSAKWGYDVTDPCEGCFFRSFESYWIFRQYFNATDIADGFAASSGDACLMIATYDTTDTDDIDKMVDFFDSNIGKIVRQYGLQDEIKHGVTGIQPFADAIIEGVNDDLELMDKAVLPIALLILACIVQSLPFMLMPILNIGCTILAEFLIMYPVALSMDVVSFTPSVMMSITIAMSIDYSLFLLSRVMEEIALGRSLDEAIPNMLDSAGHTIIVSGGTLICCFLGMLIFPLSMLRSVGIGASVALAMALAANLTLTPAILFSIGPWLIWLQALIDKYVIRRAQSPALRFMAAQAQEPPHAYAAVDNRGGTNHGLSLAGASDEADPHRSGMNGSVGNIQEPLLADSIDDLTRADCETVVASHASKVVGEPGDTAAHTKDADDVRMADSVWYRMAWELLVPKQGLFILVVVLCLCLPIAVHCLSIKTSISFDLTVPESSHAYDTYKDVEKAFGAGSVFPYSLLMVPLTNNTICAGDSICNALAEQGVECGLFCEEGFNQINHVLKRLDTKTGQDMILTGLTKLNGENVTYSQYEALIQDLVNDDESLTSYDSSLELLYEEYCEQTLTDDDTPKQACESTVVDIELLVDPFSTDGVDWLKKARNALDDLTDDGTVQFKLYLANGAAVSYDATEAVYDSFPLIIVITLVVVFCLISFAFGSLVAPLRSVCTLCLTLSFVFGLLVMTYQHGIFDFLGLRCLTNQDATCWMPPVMCFSIIVGLGLDYDVFLIARVFEYRLHGYTDHGAAVKGVVKTGFIITAAGIIMAVAFGGLFASDEIILNQVAFLLVFSVLLDTFVVRTLCVPALLGLTDRMSWWPKSMPPATQAVGF